MPHLGQPGVVAVWGSLDGISRMIVAKGRAFQLTPSVGSVATQAGPDGANEGPTPPKPTSGWPSGYPITIYGQGITVSTHQIVVDGTTTLLAHQWLAGDSTLGSSAKVLYTDAPLTANTTYRVTITGSTSSGSVSFDWKFTTGAATGGGRRG